MKKFLDLEFPNVLFLDVDYPDLLRIDHRADGLHFCIPGPIMGWIDLFMNLLIQYESNIKLN